MPHEDENVASTLDQTVTTVIIPNDTSDTYLSCDTTGIDKSDTDYVMSSRPCQLVSLFATCVTFWY